MSGAIDTLLARFGALLQGRLAAEVSPAYIASSLRITGITLAMAAEEYDRMAERHAAQNRALRTLFARAAESGAAPALAATLRAEAAGAEADLRISTLRDANARLKQVLITLHAAAQGEATPAAAALDLEIWRLLERFAADRPEDAGQG